MNHRTFNDWPDGWMAAAGQGAQLEAELARETPEGHVLFDRRVTLLATGRADDVLFGLDDGQVARVHLSWVVETDPIWPATTLFPSIELWAEAEARGEL